MVEIKINLKWLGLGLTLLGIYLLLPFSEWNFEGFSLTILGLATITHAYAEDRVLEVKL